MRTKKLGLGLATVLAAGNRIGSGVHLLAVSVGIAVAGTLPWLVLRRQRLLAA